MAKWVLGLTGGIGSGKTLASDYLASLGIDIIDADLCARQVVEPGCPALAAIAEHFGADILDAGGALQRAQLRRIIFQDEAQKHWLEALLHPLIRACISTQLARSQSSYSVLVSPLLFESGQADFCQRTLLIDAPESLQLERTLKRDGGDIGQVQAIIASQWSRERRRARADDVLLNDGDREQFYAELERLHAAYLQTSSLSQPESRYNCPRCRQLTVWQNNPYRPFCSERCRLIDLGLWLTDPEDEAQADD